MQSVKTCCFSILLAVLLLNIPHTLQAKTVAEAAGPINDDRIIKDFVGKEEPGAPYKYFNVGAAVMLSIFPVYSGSWNPGFTPLGIVFVIGKTGGLAGFLGIFLGAPDFSINKTNSYTYGFYSCLALFVYATIGDMIYSGVRVSMHNKEQKRRSDLMGKSDGVTPQVIVSLEPRTSLIHDQSSQNKKINLTTDGINVSALYRF